MKKTGKIRRQKRVRAKIAKITKRPRLSVFRSNKFIYAQVIDDVNGKTIVSASEQKVESKEKTNKIENAKKLGLLIAKLAIAKKISEVSFDRGAYKYHGRVKALAEAAREGGLKF